MQCAETQIALNSPCGRKTNIRGGKMATSAVKDANRLRSILMTGKGPYREAMMTLKPLINTLKEIEGRGVPPEKISNLFNNKDCVSDLQRFSKSVKVQVCHPGVSGEARLEWQFLIPGKPMDGFSLMHPKKTFILERIDNMARISVQNYKTGKTSKPISFAKNPWGFLWTIAYGVMDFVAYKEPKLKSDGEHQFA